MGADRCIHTEKAGVAETYMMELDLIVIMRNFVMGYPLKEYLSLVSLVS